MKMKRRPSRVGGSKKGRRRVLTVKWGLGLLLLMRHRCPLPTGSATGARCRRGRARNVQVQVLSEGGISLVVVGPFYIEQNLIGGREMKLKRELCRGVMRWKVVGVRGSLERKIRISTGVAVAAADGHSRTVLRWLGGEGSGDERSEWWEGSKVGVGKTRRSGGARSWSSIVGESRVASKGMGLGYFILNTRQKAA